MRYGVCPPEDVPRLIPAKYLKRLRSVAKSWRFLIDSENFIKLHLCWYLISGSNQNLIPGELNIYSVDMGSLDKVRLLNPPLQTIAGVMSSSSGFVLVMGEPPILWNPFSRDYGFLPASSMGYPPGFYVMVLYGFGYDSKNDDYKALKTAEFRNRTTRAPIRTGTLIYGLKSNWWKRIGDFPCSLPFIEGKSRAHVNGSFHTLVCSAGNTNAVRIMAFSVEIEKYYDVTLPEGIRVRDVDFSLTVVGGCLCLICKHKSRVVIWEMKEYGMEKSWSSLLTNSPLAVVPNELVKPVVYPRDGNKVLLNCGGKRLVLYNLRKTTVDKVHVDGISGVFYAHDCVESLVSVESPIGVKKQDREKKGKEMRKKRDDFFSVGFKLVL